MSNWKSTSDGMMKWKSNAESRLQGLGKKIGEGVRNVVKSYNSPENRFKKAQRAWYEGGKGNPPKRTDFK